MASARKGTPPTRRQEDWEKFRESWSRERFLRESERFWKKVGVKVEMLEKERERDVSFGKEGKVLNRRV